MNKGSKARTVSMKDWRTTRILKERLTRGLYYQTLVVDLAGEQKDSGLSCLEFSSDLPIDDLPDLEMIHDFEEGDFHVFLRDQEREGFISVDPVGVERYEIYDMTTDDVYVMYRIPCTLDGGNPGPLER
ncbi:MAG: hypothetical protein JW821_01385 [Deltaproteobacteria bacterium]|nr:hypothetical protein [Deltaproteobacteria bacterium]